MQQAGYGFVYKREAEYDKIFLDNLFAFSDYISKNMASIWVF